MNVNGVRVLFRYYTFLLRGYEADEVEMKYVADTLLDWWQRDPDHTMERGRDALDKLVGCQDAGKLDKLRQLVIKSFDTRASQQNQQWKEEKRGSVLPPPLRLSRSRTSSTGRSSQLPLASGVFLS